MYLPDCAWSPFDDFVPQTLFTALFIEENRRMETKHSLVDTQNYRMLQTKTNKRKGVDKLEISEPKHDISTF